MAGAGLPRRRSLGAEARLHRAIDAWITPRAADLGARIGKIEAVRRLRTPEAVAATFADGGSERWPLLFFAVWSLIHLEGAAPNDALAQVAGAI